MKLSLVFALLIAGCTTTPLTEDERFEREYRDAVTYQEWLDCQHVIRDSGGMWVTDFHITRRMERGLQIPNYMNMRADLARNHCHRILRAAGYR